MAARPARWVAWRGCFRSAGVSVMIAAKRDYLLMSLLEFAFGRGSEVNGALPFSPSTSEFPPVEEMAAEAAAIGSDDASCMILASLFFKYRALRPVCSTIMPAIHKDWEIDSSVVTEPEDLLPPEDMDNAVDVD